MHGWEVMKYCKMPIGSLSEECAECRNKDVFYNKEHHSRKNSFLNIITDLFNYMIYDSDPYLSEIRSKALAHNNYLELPDIVKDMLLEVEPETDGSSIIALPENSINFHPQAELPHESEE